MVAPRTITRTCCVCQRVELDERWVFASALEKAALLLTHTYCPECFQRALAEFHQTAAQPQPTTLVLAYG